MVRMIVGWVAMVVGLVAGPVVVSASASAQAAEWTVADWLAKDAALTARHVADVTQTPEFVEMSAQIRAGMLAYRQRINDQIAANQPPEACLPAPGSARVESDDVGRWLYAVPPDQQGQSLKDAVGAYLKQRFPCG